MGQPEFSFPIDLSYKNPKHLPAIAVLPVIPPVFKGVFVPRYLAPKDSYDVKPESMAFSQAMGEPIIISRLGATPVFEIGMDDVCPKLKNRSSS